MNHKKLITLIIILVVGAALIWQFRPTLQLPEINMDVGYVSLFEENFKVSLLDDSLMAPTRIKITPDQNHLLVTQLTGEVLAYQRTEQGWSADAFELLKIETGVPGFPPEEAGLVGLVFSSDFDETGTTFLLYTFKDEEEKIQNRISVTNLKIENGRLSASQPELIFQANIEGSPSHQITDGLAVEISGKSHLLFLIGEGFDATRAQDVSLEAGKVMLIQADGSNPLGLRPYPQNPKIQAIGIRNAYVLAENKYEKKGRVLIGDTGADVLDRLIYTRLVSEEGQPAIALNFNWDGSNESLEQALPDPRFPEVKDMVLVRLPEALTFTGLAFHSGGGLIAPSNEETQSVLITVFGKTGLPYNKPGKEIWLGQLSEENGQPSISYKTVIERAPWAEGEVGNPLGLEVDQKTGDFFFADVLEGKVYWVKLIQ